MSLDQLRELDKQIDQQLIRQSNTERAAAVEQIYSIAHSVGLPLKALFDGRVLNRKPARATSQYQDTANPNNRWSGMGRRPEWVKNALAAGRSLAEFRV